jgi:tryptophan-rich sensory protein
VDNSLKKSEDFQKQLMMRDSGKKNYGHTKIVLSVWKSMKKRFRSLGVAVPEGGLGMGFVSIFAITFLVQQDLSQLLLEHISVLCL